MKAVVAAFNQEKALVGAFSVIVQPVLEPMELYTALVLVGVGRGVRRGVPIGVFRHDISGVTASSIGQLHSGTSSSLSRWSGSATDSGETVTLDSSGYSQSTTSVAVKVASPSALAMVQL